MKKQKAPLVGLSTQLNHWWGYLHSNGSVQVKRWYGDHKDYTEDCENNPFVVKVVPPFTADTASQAFGIVVRELGKEE